MAIEHDEALLLARTLRELRVSAWPGVALTQAQLARALSAESPVASATLSSWESRSNPKTPPPGRLRAYARFFATRRSLEPEPHLIPDDQLSPSEVKRLRELETMLFGLLQTGAPSRPSTFSFTEGPITIICPEAPEDERGRLADPRNPNFNRFQRYADLDALMELWGHLRAENPKLDVRCRLPSEVRADELSGHVVLLGGIGWNRLTGRFQTAVGAVPITQVDDGKLTTGEVFRVADAAGERVFVPMWDDPAGPDRELIEDVGQIARLRNPFHSRRTLTICNGIHSRGVLGAVRCLTDPAVREANENYLAERFPEGRFAILVRVPVIANEALPPDLQDHRNRLYEWAAPDDGAQP